MSEPAEAFQVLPLHPRQRWVWALNYALAFLVPVTAACLVAAIKSKSLPILVAVLPALVISGLCGAAYARRYAVHYLAMHVEDGVLIRRGVWWRTEIFVPRARIQHTEVNQGPLDRRWGMASVSLHTAGTHLENLKLPGLPRELAQRLRDELLDRRRDVDGA